MSLMGRRTCVSASALSLDAQPAQAERVVRRISRPVCEIGILSPKNKCDHQPVSQLMVTIVPIDSYELIYWTGTAPVVSGKGKIN
jgi:hypothetical protein